MNVIKKFVGTTTLAVLMCMPLAASADSIGLRSGTGVFVGENGVVHVMGAQISAISGNIISAFTSIGNIVMNWTVNASSDTKIFAGGSKTATVADFKIGDTIAFSGTTSTSSPLSVSAKKIVDITAAPFRGKVVGTVSNVNTAAQTFTLTMGNRTVTVQANSATTIQIDGDASTFASIQNGDRVKIGGTLNAANTILTATSISVKEKREHDDKDEKRGWGRGGKFFGGLHLDFGKHEKDD